MAREVTLGVQSTLHRAHLPIPSRGLPAPSSAGLLGCWGHLYWDHASWELVLSLLPMARVLLLSEGLEEYLSLAKS